MRHSVFRRLSLSRILVKLRSSARKFNWNGSVRTLTSGQTKQFVFGWVRQKQTALDGSFDFEIIRKKAEVLVRRSNNSRAWGSGKRLIFNQSQVTGFG